MKLPRPPRQPDEANDFRDAMRDVKPLPPVNRVEPYRDRAAPLAAKRLEDERAVVQELRELALADLDDIELEDDSVYLRPGLPRDILRKLRRTHWVIQDEIDLHGMTAEEAGAATAAFLALAQRRGTRCVRIVHGKGLRSKRREPVLKGRIRKLLTRRDEVLAFVEPRSHHGGGGAVVVLLRA